MPSPVDLHFDPPRVPKVLTFCNQALKPPVCEVNETRFIAYESMNDQRSAGTLFLKLPRFRASSRSESALRAPVWLVFHPRQFLKRVFR